MGQRYQTYTRREKLAAQIRSRERIINREAVKTGEGFAVGPHDADNKVQNRSELQKINDREKKRLKQITPPDPVDLEKRGVNLKVVEARFRQLSDYLSNPTKRFPEGPCSVREMQECPPNATGKNLADEHKKKFWNVTPKGEEFFVDKKKGQQSSLEEWKDLARVLRQQDQDYNPDISNAETLRKSVDGKDELAKYPSRAYTPTKRLSAEEYIKIFGTDELSPINKAVLEREVKEGQLPVQPIEEYFDRMFGSDEKAKADKAKKKAAPKTA